MSRTVRIALSIAISAIFLAFAVRGVEWSKAAAALAGAHYIYVIPMIAITVWSLYIRAQRWRVLLRPVGRPAMRTLVAATNIGFMANMVLPLRMGEVIRPVLLSRKENEPLGGILATIVLERIFDMFTILFLFGVSAAAVTVSPTVSQWGYRLCGLALAIGAAVAFIRWQEALALRLLQLGLRPLPARLAGPIEHFFRGFVQALEILDSPLTFVQLLGWSLYLWVVIGSIYLCGIVAFDLSVPLLVGAIAVTAIVAIAVSAPSAPGYIGAFQLGCGLSLGIFGVSESDAFAYSIILHVTQFVGVVAAGLYSLWRENMSLSQVEAVSEAEGAAS
ncbi:MAG: flippase-like domain-containing protein [Deltaproteobacteria bacterium]|nr:flippase-like domain-containing protein [Deltaproteobacteria bacterium]